MLKGSGESRIFLAALLANFVWINLSEIARYFLLVRPMLQDALPDNANVAPMDWGIFALWSVWDTILIMAATGFYWLWFGKFGHDWRQITLASSAFTVTVFGLIWLGIANMGLAPYTLLYAALPLAFLEQIVAGWIVAYMLTRYPVSSMRSI